MLLQLPFVIHLFNLSGIENFFKGYSEDNSKGGEFVNHTDSRPHKPDRTQWAMLSIATGIIVIVIVKELIL